MDYAFARCGVDRMLERGEIDFMVLSHWHLDHFWGIKSTLKHNPRLKLYAPATWRPEDRALLKEKGNIQVEDRQGRSISICKNDVAHEGELILTEPEGDAGKGIYRSPRSPCDMPGTAASHRPFPTARRQLHSVGSKSPPASGAGGYRRGRQPHPETTRPAPGRCLGSQRPPPDAFRPPSVHSISQIWGSEGDTHLAE